MIVEINIKCSSYKLLSIKHFYCSIIPPNNIPSSLSDVQISSSTYIMQPVTTMSSASSGSLKHANSIRKKGRFRVRRVSKTPEGIKEGLKRDSSSSPIKSVSISTNPIYKDEVALSHINQSIKKTAGSSGKWNVVVYNVSKLFSKSYDIDLASKYTLNELGN
jgi:hypothetical protein